MNDTAAVQAAEQLGGLDGGGKPLDLIGTDRDSRGGGRRARPSRSSWLHSLQLIQVEPEIADGPDQSLYRVDEPHLIAPRPKQRDRRYAFASLRSHKVPSLKALTQ
jgi:hypothetical protein